MKGTTKRRKIISKLIVFVMVFGMFSFAPMTVSAATGAVTINVNTLAGTNQNNTASAATQSQWTYTASSNVLQLTTENGNYTLSGTNNNLTIRVNLPVNQSGMNITFDNLNVTSPGNKRALEIYDSCTINLRGVSNLIAGYDSFDATDNAIEIGSGGDAKPKCTITSSTGGYLNACIAGIYTYGTGINVNELCSLEITGNATVGTHNGKTPVSYGHFATYLDHATTLKIGPNASFITEGFMYGLNIGGYETSIIVDGVLEALGNHFYSSGISIRNGATLSLNGKGSVTAKAGFISISTNRNIKISDELTLKMFNGEDPEKGTANAEPTPIFTFEKLNAANTHQWKLSGDLNSSGKMTDSIISAPLPWEKNGTISREAIPPVKKPDPKPVVTQLSKPANLKLSAKKASWNSVANNNGYTLKLMQGKKTILTKQLKKNAKSYTFSKKELKKFKKGKKYTFTLVAKGTGAYKNSAAAKSKAVILKKK